MNDWIHIGKQEFSQHAFNSALDSFKKAINENSNSKISWLYLGMCQIKLEKYIEAEKSIKKALSIDPYFLEAKALLQKLEARKELSDKMASSTVKKIKITNILDIEGIGKEYSKKLALIGIYTVEELLKKGATPLGRKYIGEIAGISLNLILKWVKMADLFRVKGIAEEYSELLMQSGINCVPSLAQQNELRLFYKIAEVNLEKKLVRQLPTFQMVKDWIDQAKILPSLVIFDDSHPKCPIHNCYMVPRVAKRGENIGKKFWGCPEYFNPRINCKQTIEYNDWDKNINNVPAVYNRKPQPAIKPDVVLYSKNRYKKKAGTSNRNFLSYIGIAVTIIIVLSCLGSFIIPSLIGNGSKNNTSAITENSSYTNTKTQNNQTNDNYSAPIITEDQSYQNNQAQGTFYGSRKSDVYHYPSCHNVKQIHSENLISFSSVQDARSQGYEPCKDCRPPG